MPESSENTPDARESSEYRKVGECLYRHETSGTYYAWLKRSGKQYRRSLRTKDRKVAERFLAEYRLKVEKLSRTTSASRVTFGELAKQWLASMKPHLKPSSYRRRETSVHAVNGLMGNLSLRQITRHTCEHWAKKRGEGLKASSYNNERDTIRLILEYAKKEGLILDNPADDLPRRKLPKHSPMAPTKEQFASLIRTLRRTNDSRCWKSADLLELLAYSGMRLAEATSLRWGDINFEDGRFNVTGGETGTKNHESRQVPLFPAMGRLLEWILGWCPTPPERDDLVVPIKSARKAMDNACKKADLPNFTHHSLRHYFCTNAVEAAVDFKTIAAWVGHKDGGLLVAKTYGHLRDTHSYEMAKRMDYTAELSPTDQT